jgi:mRNA-degrading endonuclease RelE of RelBE toxin-antitoxin system
VPGIDPYRWYLSATAAEFLLRLPRRSQRRLLTRIEQLGRFPFQVADYRTHDEESQETFHHRDFGVVVSYSIDHAARRVMILDLRVVD